MTWEEVRAIALSLPGVEEGTSYGTPGFKVKGKFITRLRPEDNSLVLTDVPFDERDMLMEAEPETFHMTPHYRDYPAVLARIETLHPGSLRAFLERRWRNVAPRRLVKTYDDARRGQA
jgi:hypothetical protein